MYLASVLEQFRNPHGQGHFKSPDTLGRALTVSDRRNAPVSLGLTDRRSLSSSVATYHCPSAVACVSWLTRWVLGKTSPEGLMWVLGRLPLGKEHPARLVVKALRDALKPITTAAEASVSKQEGANP